MLDPASFKTDFINSNIVAVSSCLVLDLHLYTEHELTMFEYPSNSLYVLSSQVLFLNDDAI